MNWVKAWLTRLYDWLSEEPAVTAWFVNGGLAALLAKLGLNHTKEAAAVVVLTGLAALYMAFMAKPPMVAVIVGAITTIADALAAFGYHATASQIATAQAIAAAILMMLVRHTFTPKRGSAGRRRTSATNLLRGSGTSGNVMLTS